MAWATVILSNPGHAHEEEVELREQDLDRFIA